jgi:alpha-L-rhamnosidase
MNAMERLSAAHRKSQFAGIDPGYSAAECIPETKVTSESCLWLYGEAELEAWQLQRQIKAVAAAKLQVHYPGKYHEPYNSVTFRLPLNLPNAKQIVIDLYSNSDIHLYLDDSLLYSNYASETKHAIELDAGGLEVGRAQYIIICLHNNKGEPPCLHLRNDSGIDESAAWQWSADGRAWTIPRKFFSSGRAVYPHRSEEPTIRIFPERNEGSLYDFGKELYGTIQIASRQKPDLYVGESIAETLNSKITFQEQSTELFMVEGGLWQSRNLLAFRYLRLKGEENITDISCLARMHPVQYRGAFACSDAQLSRIWMHSAYTLHLCMQDFLIDGIKRDRLPWTGDLAVSLMANAYSFFDAEIVRRTLTVLGRAGIEDRDINGIIDYSLWWIIAQQLFQRYYDDSSYLNTEWLRIENSLHSLRKRCDSTGLLQIGDTWLFIDWVEAGKDTALQILWWWALDSGITLAKSIGRDSSVIHFTEWKNQLEKRLFAIGFDDDSGLWYASLNNDGIYSRHACLLAVISGLSSGIQAERIATELKENRMQAVGTPYMKSLEFLALNNFTSSSQLIEVIKNCWGGMLEKGATTFWEAYDPEESDNAAYAFYNRPYARSLCHAWSSGPCQLLPASILGIKPLEDGWKLWTVAPRLSHLQWAAAAVPIPWGTIEVIVYGDEVEIAVPEHTELVVSAKVGEEHFRGAKWLKGKIENGQLTGLHEIQQPSLLCSGAEVDE